MYGSGAGDDAPGGRPAQILGRPGDGTPRKEGKPARTGTLDAVPASALLTDSQEVRDAPFRLVYAVGNSWHMRNGTCGERSRDRCERHLASCCNAGKMI